MNEFLLRVAQFHETFQHPIPDRPVIPGDRVELRMNLISEEFKELQEAISQGDLVAVADAFADLQYVLSGAILEFGMGKIFDDLFAEVHRSNMTKECKTAEAALATMSEYGHKGVASYYRTSPGGFVVCRRSDHKTLKSVEYSEANLAPIVQSGLAVENKPKISPEHLIVYPCTACHYTKLERYAVNQDKENEGDLATCGCCGKNQLVLYSEQESYKGLVDAVETNS